LILLRRITFLFAGIILAIVILTLLVWPETASSLTLGLLLLAAPLSAFDISTCLRNGWGIYETLFIHINP
jgi:hypothetical protein